MKSYSQSVKNVFWMAGELKKNLIHNVSRLNVCLAITIIDLHTVVNSCHHNSCWLEHRNDTPMGSIAVDSSKLTLYAVKYFMLAIGDRIRHGCYPHLKDNISHWQFCSFHSSFCIWFQFLLISFQCSLFDSSFCIWFQFLSLIYRSWAWALS